MKITLIVVSLIVAITQAAPSSQGYTKQKIVFSKATSIDYNSIKSEDRPALVKGTNEYYKALRLVYVTADGYEYTEPVEDVIKYMNDVSSQAKLNTDRLGAVMVEKRKVIGTDTRQLVQTNDDFPYTAIGRFALGCTGTFIAPGVILTSAHCLYDHDSGWYSGLYLKFRREKGCDPSTGFPHTWKRSVVLDGYKTNHDINYDVGLVIVEETSPVHMLYTAATNIPLSTINLAGYPIDKPNRCLWLSSCTLTRVTPHRLRYPCDTYNGNSGSPVYYPSGPNPHVIYAVHGYGSTQYNTAIRITQDLETKLIYASRMI